MNQDFKKKQNIAAINEQYGKIPPQAVDLEECILAAYLVEEMAYALNPINPKCFYKKEHQIICEAIKELNDSNKPIDLVLVSNYLRDTEMLDEAGGILYITDLTGRVANASHIAYHISIIQQSFIKREIIRKTSEIQNACFDGSIEVEDLIIACEDLALTAMDESQNSTVSFSDTLPMLAERIETNQFDNKKLTGIPTGLIKIDKHTGGHQKQDFTIIIAYASDGKTALAVQLAKHAARDGYPVKIISLEMSAIQLSSRIVSQDSGVSSKSILSEKLNPSELTDVNKAMKDLNGLPIFYEERISNKIAVICNSIRRAVIRDGVKMAIVDYLQLCEGEGKGETEKAGNVARTLKNLAKELDIPIIGLAQLVKNADRERPPQISNILWSAEIEQAADNVISLWQPARWLPKGSTWEYSDTIQFNFTNNENQGITFVAFLKGRNIGLTEFLLTFKQHTTTFLDYIGDRIDEYVPEDEEIESNVNFYEKESDDRPF